MVSVAILILAFALPLRGLMRYQGPPMEEGFMLAFPQEVLRGSIPNKDFLHLYGPGSLWALAGTFWVFGTSLATERMFGLLQHAGIVFGVYAIARPWGRKLAVVCGLVSLVIVVPPIGLTALAWNGAVALGVWSVRSATPGRWFEVSGDGEPQVSSRRLFVAGLLAGVALLFRPDLVVALGLGLAGALWRPTWARVRPVLVGLVAGASPILIHLATAGIGNSFQGMFIDPVFRLRPGRSLPVPPSWNELDGFLQKAAGLRTLGWPFPSPSSAQQVALWFWLLPVIVAFVAGVGIWAVRRDPASARARTLRAIGLFGLGMMAQAMQRPDTAHFAWVSCVPVALLPLAVHEVLPARIPRPSWRAGAAAVAPLVAFVTLAVPHYTLRTYIDLTGQSLGRNVFGYPVNHAGRNFYYGSAEAATAANELIAELSPRAQSGERLFVGPVDLRQTPYSDAFFYFLFPDLVPATYFIEMDPGVANREDSRLADDIATADWLILSNVWTNWSEPNTSREFGPDEPNRVVEELFCVVGTFGDRDGDPWFELYERC